MQMFKSIFFQYQYKHFCVHDVLLFSHIKTNWLIKPPACFCSARSSNDLSLYFI